MAWRMTGNCDPNGPREWWNDKPCDADIPNDASGYCQCFSIKQMMKDCSKGENRNCYEACKSGKFFTRSFLVMCHK